MQLIMRKMTLMLLLKIFLRFKNNLVVYCGAGTHKNSGSKWFRAIPNFWLAYRRTNFIIAGNKAIFKAVEKSEDNIKDAISQVTNKNINKNDVVIGSCKWKYSFHTSSIKGQNKEEL